MKLTEDGHIVSELDLGYEIAYHWLNAETSLAEALQVTAKDTQGKIWKDIVKCERACLLINAGNKPVYIGYAPTIKMIAPCQTK